MAFRGLSLNVEIRLAFREGINGTMAAILSQLELQAIDIQRDVAANPEYVCPQVVSGLIDWPGGGLLPGHGFHFLQ